MKWKTDPQLLIAIGVLIASFSALFVYMRQAAIMNDQTEILLRQSRAGAWPHLDIGLNVSTSTQVSIGSDTTRNNLVTRFEIEVTNKGTGPAIINGVRLSYAEQAVTNWTDLFDKANKPDSIMVSMSTSGTGNSVVSANESITILSLEDPGLGSWIHSIAGDMKLDVCYTSVFEESWIVSRKGFVGMEQSSVTRTENCSSLGDDLFVN